MDIEEKRISESVIDRIKVRNISYGNKTVLDKSEDEIILTKETIRQVGYCRIDEKEQNENLHTENIVTKDYSYDLEYDRSAVFGIEKYWSGEGVWKVMICITGGLEILFAFNTQVEAEIFRQKIRAWKWGLPSTKETIASPELLYRKENE